MTFPYLVTKRGSDAAVPIFSEIAAIRAISPDGSISVTLSPLMILTVWGVRFIRMVKPPSRVLLISDALIFDIIKSRTSFRAYFSFLIRFFLDTLPSCSLRSHKSLVNKCKRHFR